MSSTTYNHQRHCWSPEGHCDNYLPDTGRNDLRRSSLSLTAAVSAAGDAEELVHLALAGEPTLARRIARFIDTAHLPDLKFAGDVLGVQPLQVSRERSYLADGLGDDLYTATLPKMLSSAGSELLDLASPHRDRLREIGRDAPGRRDSADGPNSAVGEAQNQRKTRRRHRPTANGLPEQIAPYPIPCLTTRSPHSCANTRCSALTESEDYFAQVIRRRNHLPTR